MTSINVIGREVDGVLLGIRDRCAHVERVSSLDEVRAVLERRLDAPSAGPATLDLLGHSTNPMRLLRLGDTVIDMFDVGVRDFFEDLARDEVLPRAGIHALRLLGCNTASRPVGQRTMLRLRRTLGVLVYGTTKPLLKSHYGPGGFRPELARHCLVEASRLSTML